MKKTIISMTIFVLIALSTALVVCSCNKADHQEDVSKNEEIRNKPESTSLADEISLSLESESTNQYSTKTYTVKNIGCEIKNVSLEFIFKSDNNIKEAKRFILKWKKRARHDFIFGSSEYPEGLKVVEIIVKCDEGERKITLFQE